MDEKKLKTEKLINRRNTIGWIALIVLSTMAYNEYYINFTLVFMIMLPYMAIVTWLNALSDENNHSKNLERLTMLAFVLAFFSFALYKGQMENDVRVNNAIRECKSYMKFNNLDNEICYKMKSTIFPSDDYGWGDRE